MSNLAQNIQLIRCMNPHVAPTITDTIEQIVTMCLGMREALEYVVRDHELALSLNVRKFNDDKASEFRQAIAASAQLAGLGGKNA